MMKLVLLSLFLACAVAQILPNGVYFRPKWYGSCDSQVQVVTTNGVTIGTIMNGGAKGKYQFVYNPQNITQYPQTSWYFYSVTTRAPCNFGVVDFNITNTSPFLSFDVSGATGNTNCLAPVPASAYLLPSPNICQSLINKNNIAISENVPVEANN